MDLTDKVETVRVSLPCLLSVEKDITQPRLPSYVRKQAMKDAPIHRLTLADMEDTDAAHYGLSGSPTQVQRIFPPESNHKQEKWTGTGRSWRAAVRPAEGTKAVAGRALKWQS